MIGPQGGSGPGWYYKGKHYDAPQLLHEAMNSEIDRLKLQVGDLQKALDKFGDHLGTCAMYDDQHNRCDCGYLTYVTEKLKEDCPFDCLKRWPDMGHRFDCPTRKCAKHGLTVCDECAIKRNCEHDWGAAIHANMSTEIKRVCLKCGVRA